MANTPTPIPYPTPEKGWWEKTKDWVKTRPVIHGAVIGAGGGALVGTTVLPGVGTAGGAIIGGVGGAINGAIYKNAKSL